MTVDVFRRHSKVCGNSECRELSPRGKDLAEADLLALEAGWVQIDNIWFCSKHGGAFAEGAIPSADEIIRHMLVGVMSLPLGEDTPKYVQERLDTLFALARSHFIFHKMDIDRKALFSLLLENSPSVFVMAFPHADLLVPKDLGFPLTLEYGLNMPNPIPDLKIEDEGIRATLSFSRVPTPSFVPWKSIGAMRGAHRGTVYWADAQEGFTVENITRKGDPEHAMCCGVDNKGKGNPPRLSLVTDDDAENT